MFIIKRNGRKEEVKLDKILARVSSHCEDLKHVEPVKVAQKVVGGLYDGISSTKIDELLAETAALHNDEHPEYGLLAGRIAISALHKETTASFYQTMKNLYKQDALSDDFIAKVKKYSKELEKIIDFERDFNFDYFGVKTMTGKANQPGYLMRIETQIVERPQHMFMRVAVAVADDNLKDIKELYDLISNGFYTHATPTLFNAGHKRPQLASCFLVQLEDDSIEGIYNTAKEAAMISKYAGGIGIHCSNLRASGSYIRGNNGYSNGIIPWMRTFNEVARAVNQGGKRKGSIAMYLEPWHADVESFLELPKEVGPEEIRARDLFLAMWMPDLFFKRAENNEDWSLFCPNECPGLQDVYGDEFDALYLKYESTGKARKKIKARDLLAKMCECQIEHGMPYVLSKDSINKKSNQKNIGIIKSSNLCAEIVEVSTPEETAVCNLASVMLPKYVKSTKKEFDFKKLEKIVRIATRNLNNVIDRTFYPTEKTRRSNLRHRPIAIGVQGLADVFFLMGLAFDSQEALDLDRQIFETMYYAFLSESMELAKEQGAYETFKGSPASEGILQHDMWGVPDSDRYDWKTLREEIKTHGLRNSLGIALMPTASTASIFANIEAMEPQKSNLFKREVLSGEFMIVNKHLVRELEKLGLWDKATKDQILANRGSVQGIQSIPESIQNVYKTAYELKQKVIIDHAAARGPYIDQTQSMNLFFEEPKIGALSSAMMYSWKLGLKTLNYYIRSKAKAKAAVVGGPITQPVPEKYSAQDAVACSIDNKEDCEACGS